MIDREWVIELLREADRLNAKNGVKTEHLRGFVNAQRELANEVLGYARAVKAREAVDKTRAAMDAAMDPFAHAALEEEYRRIMVLETARAREAPAKRDEMWAETKLDFETKAQRKQKLSDDAARLREVKAKQATRAKRERANPK